MESYKGMRAFVAVVQSGSFSGAAERLGMSRSMTTKYVADLEKRLGARLLNRSTRKMSLTEIGKDYFEQSRVILEALDSLEERVALQTRTPRGTLRITAPVHYGSNSLPAILAEYLEVYPEISFTLDLDDRFLDIIDKEYDVALRIADLDDSSAVARKLFDIPCYMCASPAYLAENGRPVSPAELSKHNCLRYSNLKRKSIWSYRVSRHQTVSIPVHGNAFANNGEALCHLAVSGAGVILEPEFVVRKAIEEGSLTRLFPEYDWSPRALYVVYPSKDKLPLKTRNFIDFLVAHPAVRG